MKPERQNTVDRNPRLVVNNLSVAFRTRKELIRAVTGVSFVVEAGTIVGLWGHSGCGKSTILKALLGLPIDEPGWISGEVQYEQSPVSPKVSRFIHIDKNGKIRKNAMGFYRSHQSRLRRFLGTRWRSLFQEPIYSFDPDLPVDLQVRRALQSFASKNSTSPDDLMQDFRENISRMNLAPDYLRNRSNLQLSGGECQRILLAMSIVGKPQLLFADEPTTAMDQETRLLANQLLKERVQTTGMSVLLASHNREELLTLADRIVVLCDGQIVEEFQCSKLRTSPTEDFHPYTRKLWFSQDTDLPTESAPAFHESLGGCPHARNCTDQLDDKLFADRCREELPPLFQIGKDHRASCWLFEKEVSSASESHRNGGKAS